MKTPFLCFVSTFAAFVSGAATPFFLTTGEDVFAFAAALALLLAFFAFAGALSCQRAELSRTMIRDLRSIEALLDDREFDHG